MQDVESCYIILFFNQLHLFYNNVVEYLEKMSALRNDSKVGF